MGMPKGAAASIPGSIGAHEPYGAIPLYFALVRTLCLHYPNSGFLVYLPRLPMVVGKNKSPQGKKNSPRTPRSQLFRRGDARGGRGRHKTMPDRSPAVHVFLFHIEPPAPAQSSVVAAR
jgi:hypothetical protein